MPKSRTVLVVEDDFLLLLNARLLFENTGYSVHSAINATEALDLLERHDDIDTVVTDIAMPGPMDGLAMAHEVHRRWPAVNMFVITGSSDVDVQDLPPNARLLRKPYTASQLTRLIELRPAA